jgi:hypothetical protein
MNLMYPKVKIDSKSRVYVIFNQNNKRNRLFNGSKINSEIYPNSYSISDRMEIGKLLASEVYKFLREKNSYQKQSKTKLLFGLRIVMNI